MEKVLVSGGLIPTTKDTLLDARSKVPTFADIANIENPARFMTIVVEETGKKYEVRKLVSKVIGGLVVENAAIDINDPDSLLDLGLAEELRAEDEKVRQTNEEARKTAENKRIEDENKRKSNESTREASENQRIANEKARNNSEEVRKTNETSRETSESKRQSNEATRLSQESSRVASENQRSANETARKESESERKTSETERKTSEQSRKDAENTRVRSEQNRIASETSRSNAEDKRVANENQRISNEQDRQGAELSREQAEGNRATTFETLKGELQTTIQEGQTANTLSEEATKRANEAADVIETWESVVVSVEDEGEVNDPESDIVNEALRKTPQTLTKAEQTQARTNIGAASLEENADFKKTITDQVNNYRPIEITGDVTNAADEEDLTSDENNLLKLKDRNNLNGMGHIILRKNKTFAEQLTQTNTIYEIRYDFDLNDEEVTIPEGCVLDFQGGSIENGTITLNKTKIIGDAKIRCNVIGTINPLAPIMADWFCLNELEDATDKIKMIFRLSYNSVNNTGWRKCVPIYFGASTYNTKGSIIDSTITAGQLTVFGNRATTFNHTGDTPLLNNLGYIGFATFYGIAFKGNGTNTFSVMQGGGGGNAQSIYYKECRFNNWKTVASYTGDTMTSEMVFDLCKISSCGNVGNPATLFIWDNPQSVNNRFICTDIESIYGTIFKLLSGANITIYQGSIILQSNNIEDPFCFISVPNEAAPETFGQNNMPNIIVNESRFELRGYGRLVDKRNYNANLSACFENCGLGGYNITEDETVQTIYLNGACSLLFNNCFNTTNFSCYSNSVNSNPKFQIIRSDDYAFIQQLMDNLVIGSQVSNVNGRVNFIHTITGEKWIPVSQSIKKSVTTRGAIEISEFLSASYEHNTIFISPISPDAANIVFNKECYITGLSLMSNSMDGWGNSVISVDVSLIDINDSEQSVLKTNITVSKASENNAYIPVPIYIKAIKLTCSLLDWQTTTAFAFRGFLKITHI